jgi:hypothetical protein
MTIASIAAYLANLPDVRGYDLATLESLCAVPAASGADVVDLSPTEILDLIAEHRRMIPVVVAVLAWRADPTTAPWLTSAIDEYRRQRRSAGVEPAKEAP